MTTRSSLHSSSILLMIAIVICTVLSAAIVWPSAGARIAATFSSNSPEDPSAAVDEGYLAEFTPTQDQKPRTPQSSFRTRRTEPLQIPATVQQPQVIHGSDLLRDSGGEASIQRSVTVGQTAGYESQPQVYVPVTVHPVTVNLDSSAMTAELIDMNRRIDQLLSGNSVPPQKAVEDELQIPDPVPRAVPDAIAPNSVAAGESTAGNKAAETKARRAEEAERLRERRRIPVSYAFFPAGNRTSVADAKPDPGRPESDIAVDSVPLPPKQEPVRKPHMDAAAAEPNPFAELFDKSPAATPGNTAPPRDTGVAKPIPTPGGKAADAEPLFPQPTPLDNARSQLKIVPDESDTASEDSAVRLKVDLSAEPEPVRLPAVSSRADLFERLQSQPFADEAPVPPVAAPTATTEVPLPPVDSGRVGSFPLRRPAEQSRTGSSVTSRTASPERLQIQEPTVPLPPVQEPQRPTPAIQPQSHQSFPQIEIRPRQKVPESQKPQTRAEQTAVEPIGWSPEQERLADVARSLRPSHPASASAAAEDDIARPLFIEPTAGKSSPRAVVAAHWTDAITFPAPAADGGTKADSAFDVQVAQFVEPNAAVPHRTEPSDHRSTIPPSADLRALSTRREETARPTSVNVARLESSSSPINHRHRGAHAKPGNAERREDTDGLLNSPGFRNGLERLVERIRNPDFDTPRWIDKMPESRPVQSVRRSQSVHRAVSLFRAAARPTTVQ